MIDNMNNKNLSYMMLEIKYKEKNKNLIKINPIELYPPRWFSITNYKLKSEILIEAIENDILISKTQSYKKMIEGVKNKNNI